MTPSDSGEITYEDLYHLQQKMYDKLESFEKKVGDRMDSFIASSRSGCAEHCDLMTETKDRVDTIETRVSLLIAGLSIVVTGTVAAFALVIIEKIV